MLEHEPGMADEAAVRVGSWSRDELHSFLPLATALVELLPAPGKPRLERVQIHPSPFELERLRETARGIPRRAGSSNEFLIRAAVFHADVVMLGAVDRAPREPVINPRLARNRAQVRINLTVVDGEYAGLETAQVHWDLARLALDGVTPDPSGSPDVLQWYRTIAAHFFYRGNLADAVPHLNRARQLFPADAGVLFDSGCLHEAFASPYLQQVAQTTVMPGGLTIQIGTARANLARAEEYFRRAVELQPEFDEAGVRLNRVVALQGRQAEASKALAAGMRRISHSRVEYYAALFLGDALQALGGLDDAHAAYVRSGALFPQAQSPLLAIGLLERQRGAFRASETAIQRALALSAPDQAAGAEDPWWEYHQCAGWEMPVLLEALYRRITTAADR